MTRLGMTLAAGLLRPSTGRLNTILVAMLVVVPTVLFSANAATVRLADIVDLNTTTISSGPSATGLSTTLTINPTISVQTGDTVEFDISFINGSLQFTAGETELQFFAFGASAPLHILTSNVFKFVGVSGALGANPLYHDNDCSLCVSALYDSPPFPELTPSAFGFNGIIVDSTITSADGLSSYTLDRFEYTFEALDGSVLSIIPEPTSFVLLGTALMCLGAICRRKRKFDRCLNPLSVR